MKELFFIFKLLRWTITAAFKKNWTIVCGRNFIGYDAFSNPDVIFVYDGYKLLREIRQPTAKKVSQILFEYARKKDANLIVIYGQQSFYNSLRAWRYSWKRYPQMGGLYYNSLLEQNVKNNNKPQNADKAGSSKQ